MRRAFLIWATILAIAGTTQPAGAQDCADADPLRVTAKVLGDFEFTPDPSDPAQHLIYVNHVHNGRSSIVIARVNGVTGKFEASTLTDIADNFQGNQIYNGPEFIHPPGLGLGVLYRALDGVHAVFRPATPAAWSRFTLDVKGMPATMNPPVLASSYPRSYETGGLALGQNTYALFDGPCTLRCFASVLSGKPTDAAREFLKAGLTIPTIESVVQSVRDGTILAEACTRQARINGVCSLYEATIDGAGGFLPGSPKSILTLPARVGALPGRIPLATATHPVTGTTVIFLGAEHESGSAIDVYQQPAAGGTPTLVARVPVDHSDHYRVRTGATDLVLNYIIRHGSQTGSYTIDVTAPGGQLQVSQSKALGNGADGSEVEYLPAAGRYAYYYRTSRDPSLIQRCFFNP